MSISILPARAGGVFEQARFFGLLIIRGRRSEAELLAAEGAVKRG